MHGTNNRHYSAAFFLDCALSERDKKRLFKQAETMTGNKLNILNGDLLRRVSTTLLNLLK